jgi:hypothetical protein
VRGKMDSAQFACRIVHFLPYRAGGKRHSAGLMYSTKHYILWYWMIMQLRA